MIGKFINSVFVKHTSIYFLTNLLNAAIPFLLLPIMTKYLSPYDYGIVSTFSVISSVCSILTNINLYGAIERQFFQKDINLSMYIGNCAIIVFFAALTFFIGSLLLDQMISSLLQFPEHWISVAVLGTFFSFFSVVLITLFRLELKPKLYGIFQVVQGLSGACLGVLLVVSCSMGWQGRLLSMVVTTILTGIVAIILIVKKGYITLSFKKKYLNDALSFGMPLVPYALSSIVMNMMDKLIISSLLGMATTGVYAIGSQFGMIISMITSSFNSVWVGWLYAKLQKENYTDKVLVVKITYAYFVTVILLCFVLAFFAPYILHVMVNKAYYGATEYIFWIGLGYAINGMYMMVGNYIFFAARTSILAYISVICAAINVVLTYGLVGLNGAVGAAQAIVLSNLVFFLLTWYYSAKVYSMPWKLWRIKRT